MSWGRSVVQKERSRATVITVTVAAPTGTQKHWQERECLGLFSGYHLSDFTIGVTDVSPTEQTPASLGDNNYTVCAVYQGTVPAAQTVDIQCSTSKPVRGRYLFILRKGYKLHLQLCELEVYAWTSTGKSYKMYSFHIASRLHSRSTSAYPNDMCAQTVRAGCHRTQRSISPTVSRVALQGRYIFVISPGLQDDLRLGEVEVYVFSYANYCTFSHSYSLPLVFSFHQPHHSLFIWSHPTVSLHSKSALRS